MQNCQDILKTRKRLSISAFSICMNVPLKAISLVKAEKITKPFQRKNTNF